LNEQLTKLQSEIAARQQELLRLQQSIQAESAKLAQLSGTGTPVVRASVESPIHPAEAPRRLKSARAYDLDRQGRQLYREQKYDLALQKLQQAVGLKAGDPVLLNNLGFLYYKVARYDEALAYLQKTLAADPRRKEAYGNIADTYLKLGRREEARSSYVQYLALYPASPRAGEVKKILDTLN